MDSLQVHINLLPIHCYFNMQIATNGHIKRAEHHVFLVYLRMLNMPIYSNLHVWPLDEKSEHQLKISNFDIQTNKKWTKG